MSKENAPNGREPIKIAELKFLPIGGGQPTQGGPHESGLDGSPSALRSVEADPRKRRSIEHLPWVRQYRVTNLDTGVQFRIHEHRVDWAQTVEEWQAADKARKARQEAK